MWTAESLNHMVWMPTRGKIFQLLLKSTRLNMMRVSECSQDALILWNSVPLWKFISSVHAAGFTQQPSQIQDSSCIFCFSTFHYCHYIMCFTDSNLIISESLWLSLSYDFIPATVIIRRLVIVTLLTQQLLYWRHGRYYSSTRWFRRNPGGDSNRHRSVVQPPSS